MRLRLSGLFLIVHAVACAAATPNHQTDSIETSQGTLKLTPLYHGSVMLDFGGKIIHVDPWSQADYAGVPLADMILITHTHADHMDPAILKTLKKASTIIVTSPAVADTLNGAAGEVETISNGEKKTYLGIEIEAIPMYNLVSDLRQGSRFTIKALAMAMFSVLARRGCISRATPSASPR
jgi:L-ascorbate metabolism protein UlaG (beta-lactamase superfamily)